MEYRRQEDYGVNSISPFRLRNQRIQRLPDLHLICNRDLTERSPRFRISPARRVRGGGLLERRDYGWENGETMRFRSPSPNFLERLPSYRKASLQRDELIGETMRFRSPSPDFRESLPNNGKGSLQRDELRRYEFPDFVDRKNELDAGLKHRSLRGNAERDRVLSSVGNQFFEMPVTLVDGRIAREKYGSLAKLVPDLRRADDAVDLPASSRNSHFRFKDESFLYPDPYLRKNLSGMDRYENGEKYPFPFKDLSYSGSANLAKDFSNSSKLTEFAGSSLQNSRENLMVSYRHGVHSARDIHSRSSIQQREEFSSLDLHQRHNSETRVDHESSQKDPHGYQWSTFCSTRADDQEYPYRRPDLYPRPELQNTDYLYPSGSLGRKMPFVEPKDCNEADFITPELVKFTKKYTTKDKYSRGLHGRSSSWDHQCLEDQSYSEYFLANGAQRERLRMSPDNPYDVRECRHDLKGKGMRSYEVDTSTSLEGSVKRKYGIDEELSRSSTRLTTSSKAKNIDFVMARNERFDDWNVEDDIDVLLPKSSECYHDPCRRATTKAFDVVQHDGVSPSDDWLDCDPETYIEEHSTKPNKLGKRNVKGHFRPGSSNGYDFRPGSSNAYDSYRFKKHHPTKSPWPRSKDNKQLDEDECTIDALELDNLPSSFQSGPTEDSEEFKQLVKKFFLVFSKKLNVSPATRKRYKEQGRAGPLFCIVCSQSVSKEFKDTKGLVIHCFMSQRAGLRAQHLGLHKAICVLLGWESVVAPDVTTPIPKVISVSEALSQKEDLILWSPVVIIHYIPMLFASCPGAQIIFTTEAVEDFLRGNGFSIGKIKVSLGTSPNNSVMLVKFLGTFPGLQEAEKLHKYFVDGKRGRTGFERTLVEGNVRNLREGRKNVEKLDESALYGYMGIAEDLDEVDHDTKRRCLIRSRKEIQDFENAPIYDS